MVNGPYFVVEGDDVSAYSTLREVEADLESIDVEAGAFRLFRFDGPELRLATEGPPPPARVHKRRVIATDEAIGRDPRRLAEVLRTFLREPLPKRLKIGTRKRTL